MSEPSNTLLLQRIDEQIAVLTLNRPEALNSLTLAMVDAFNQHLDNIAQDSSVRVLILNGSGRAFCAGMDIKGSNEQNQGGDQSAAEKIRIQTAFSGMVQRIRKLEQPVIAAVNGPAAGAGMALSLAADIRIASHSSKFLIAAVKLGLTAGECGISYHLPRLIGASRAFEIMLTGRAVEAKEAEHWGLVSRLVDGDNLDGEALALARAIISNSPYAVRNTKSLMWQNLDAPSIESAIHLENQVQIIASMTEDFKEATSAFSEKRAPQFTGQ